MGLFGFGRKKAADQGPLTAALRDAGVTIPPEATFSQVAAQPPTFEGIHAYWSAIGESEPDLFNLSNSPTTGRPLWPGTRQNYRVVRTPSTVVIATEGLSDVGAAGPSVPGIGAELYIESPELVGADMTTLQYDWRFSLLRAAAAAVADMGPWGLTDTLRQQGGLLSTDFLAKDHPGVPPQLIDDQGLVGALLGVPPVDRPTVAHTAVGDVDMVALTIVTPADLAVITTRHGDGRSLLAAQRAADGRHHLTLTPR